MLRPALPLVIVVLILTALSGCGSGDQQTGTTGGGGLDRAALAARANAICAKYRSRFLDISLPTDLTDLKAVARYAADSHSLFQERHAELAALTPDATAAPRWKAFIAANRKTTDVLGELEAAARAKDVTAMANVTTKSQTLLQQGLAAADAAGATGCGSKAAG